MVFSKKKKFDKRKIIIIIKADDVSKWRFCLFFKRCPECHLLLNGFKQISFKYESQFSLSLSLSRGKIIKVVCCRQNPKTISRVYKLTSFFKWEGERDEKNFYIIIIINFLFFNLLFSDTIGKKFRSCT